MRHSLFITLLVALLLLPATPVAAQVSTGCNLPAASGALTLTVPWGGLQRAAILHTPAGYQPGTAYPLILNLHAYTSTAGAEEAVTNMDAEPVLVAYPQGIAGSNGQDGWNIPGPTTDEPADLAGLTWAADDAGFLGALVAQIEAIRCVDTTRVDVTGYSMGGIMAFALACQPPAWLAAIEPVAATPPSGGNCMRVPYLAFHGEQDTVDRYQGNGGNPALPTILGCSGGTQQQDVLTQPCGGGTLVSVTDGGHTWPGSPYGWLLWLLGLGVTTQAVSASDQIVQFAAAHPLQGR